MTNDFTDWIMPPQPMPNDPQERVGDSDFPLDYFTPEGTIAEFTPPQPTSPTIQKEVSSYNTDLRRAILRNLVDFLDIRLKHQAGRHNQKRHGWRYGVKPGSASVGGQRGAMRALTMSTVGGKRSYDEAKRIVAASTSMHRTPEPGERTEYRKRAGLVTPPPKRSTAPTPAPAPVAAAPKPAKPKRVPKPKSTTPPPPATPTVDIPYRPSEAKQRAAYKAIDDYLRLKFDVPRDQIPAARKALEADLKNIVDRSPLVVRAPGDAAAAIIAEGRWKSQHESGSSRGSYTPSGRVAAENSGLGTPDGLPNNKRPIYGYLKGATNKSSEASSYGEVIFNMKPAARNRATFTLGDSLGNFLAGSVIGTPVVKPNLGSLPKDYISGSVSRKSDGTFAIRNEYHGYFEAQIHGGVKLTDVKSVTFTEFCFKSSPSRSRATKELRPTYAAMETALKAKGIEVIYAPNEN